MKLLTVLNILVEIILVLGVGVTANTITMGCVVPNERHLASKRMFAPSTWFTIHTVNITYPTKTNSEPGIVSRIVITDWGSPENYAYFSLVDGGLGKNYVTISAESQSGELLDCTIDIFGH